MEDSEPDDRLSPVLAAILTVVLTIGVVALIFSAVVFQRTETRRKIEEFVRANPPPPPPGVKRVADGSLQIDYAYRLFQADHPESMASAESGLTEYETLIGLLGAYYARNTERQIADAVKAIQAERQYYESLDFLSSVNLLFDTIPPEFVQLYRSLEAQKILEKDASEEITDSERQKLSQMWSTISNDSVSLVADDICAWLEYEALKPALEAQARAEETKAEIQGRVAQSRLSALQRGFERNELFSFKQQVRWLRYGETGM